MAMKLPDLGACPRRSLAVIKFFPRQSEQVARCGAAPNLVVPCVPPPHPGDEPLPAEPEGDLIERVAELRAVVSELSLLSTRIQELEQSEFKALEAKM